MVLEYTDKAGGMAGNRYRTHLGSREEYDEWVKDLGPHLKVVDHGVTDEEALALIDEIPLETRMNAGIEAATKGGELNEMVLARKI